MEVTIEDGYISDIQVVSADGEDAAYYNMAIDVLDSIIADQSCNVDVVSGATYTSNGIIGAAKEALGKAGGAE
ncbi:MAG: FMN-binding protein [Anaerovoracaceae bacterium]